MVSRGIRNNNPFNIRISSTEWVGKINPGTDEDFEQFDTPQHGIRAGVKILVNYYRLYGLQTVEQIIHRFAPPTENDTGAYVNAVAYDMDVAPDTCLNMLAAGTYEHMVPAIIRHENGQQPYPITMIADVVSECLIPFA